MNESMLVGSTINLFGVCLLNVVEVGDIIYIIMLILSVLLSIITGVIQAVKSNKKYSIDQEELNKLKEELDKLKEGKDKEGI